MWSAPPTDFDLVTNVHPRHIAARVRVVAITPEIAERFLREIRRNVVGKRFANVLIELELAHALDENEAFDVMRTFSRVMPGLKVAIVNRDPRHHTSLGLGAHMSQQSGYDHRYFTDPSTAEAWLTS